MLFIFSYGHYAVEKLIQNCNEGNRLELLNILYPHMIEVACHKQGSFSIQTIMDYFHTGMFIYILFF